MTCPSCGNAVPEEPVTANICLCQNAACLASLVLEGYHFRRATEHDTAKVLSDAELAVLRKARKKYRESAA